MSNLSVYEYDVFMSYAVEDKEELVNELAERLRDSGVKVWYASWQLQPGERLSNRIRDGLIKSQHGIVVISTSYLTKEWPRKEYHILWANTSDPQRRIFPVWLDVNEADIYQFDPELADLFALKCRDGLDHIVSKLNKAIKE